MELGLQFHEQLYSLGSFVPDEFTNIATRIRASWLIEHTEDDTHAAITANSLSLGRATGDTSGTLQFINFARPSGFGYGVSGDRFGLRSIALNTDEQLLLENIVVGNNSSAGKANIWIKAIGWNTTGAVAGATIQLRSEVGVSSLTFTATSLSFVGTGVLTGTLNVTGAVDFDSTLNVDGAATLQSSLHVVGATTLDSTLHVIGQADFTAGAGVKCGTLSFGNAFWSLDNISSRGVISLGASVTTTVTVAEFSNANGVIGSISINGSATTYNTSSDKRLKQDEGVATDFSALLGVKIHDFRWLINDGADRGVFAQDEATRFPRAVTPGTPDRPWQVDYSKFVPDVIGLIQQHERRLQQLGV